MEKKQTALNELLEWVMEFEDKPVKPTLTNMKEKIWQLLPKEREQMVDLVQSLKDYTNESHSILGHDDREASEFVDIHYTQTFKP